MAKTTTIAINLAMIEHDIGARLAMREFDIEHEIGAAMPVQLCRDGGVMRCPMPTERSDVFRWGRALPFGFFDNGRQLLEKRNTCK